MALIKCRECGNEISDKAISCPKCGAPQSMRKCKECGFEMSDKSISCPKCGAPSLGYDRMVDKTKMNMRASILVSVLTFIAILFAESSGSSFLGVFILTLAMIISSLTTAYWLIKYQKLNNIK